MQAWVAHMWLEINTCLRLLGRHKQLNEICKRSGHSNSLLDCDDQRSYVRNQTACACMFGMRVYVYIYMLEPHDWLLIGRRC